MSSHKGWVLVLGSSSGFGAACSRALAKAGYNIFGVHLDRAAGLQRVSELVAELQATGAQVRFWNKNVARDEVRLEVIAGIAETLTGKPVDFGGLALSDENNRDAALTILSKALEDHKGAIKAMLHSVAFGSLQPFVSDNLKEQTSRKQMEMTLDVMANSMVYWVQDLARTRLVDRGSKVFSMTSAGSRRAWGGYGPVSAAKAALEAHTRQLARELGPRGILVNCFEAGVTDTPALRLIPGSDVIKEEALRRNPGERLTTPEDIAATFVALMDPRVRWISGTTVRVDGGEDTL
ncbi:MAG: SDR family oxidoreductase [Anaerolineae bacterium]|nr:SDR family oxidoreductase [Anaerolineae bacterium]